MKTITVIIIALFSVLTTFSQTSSATKLTESINEVFESYAHYNRFIGNVLISKNDKIIYKKSFGYADAENLKMNAENSIFSIASVTKSLTAVGIMKLVEQGKLTLETPISTYFPDFIPEYSKQITIRHLLNHSSGMQANIGRIDDQGNGLMPGVNPISLNELFEKFKASKLKYEPGAGYEYNNLGYTLLAYIIEAVTQLSYADYMEQTVFAPANMRNTSINDYKVSSQRAFSHIGLGMNKFSKLKSVIHSSWLKGAGDINSTTGDLYNFMQALDNGTVLQKASVEKLYSYTQTRGVNDSKYGLGWVIETKGGEKWINHTGLLPGSTAIIGSFPREDITIIILSNATSTDLISETDFQGKAQFVDGEILDHVVAVLQGENPELLPVKTKVKKQNEIDYSGAYRLDSEHTLLLNKEENTYFIEALGNESWSIFTYKFSRDAKKDTHANEIALLFAKAMSSQYFEGLSKSATGDMKTFLSSEEGINQLKGMWTYFTKQAGEFLSYNIYKTEGDAGNTTVNIRFHFEKEDVGFVVGMNSDNLIQGMFMDDNIRTSSIRRVELTQVSENDFFINGHQNNGMQDLRIKLFNKELVLIDDHIEYKAALTIANSSK